jgi:hypothetical protein
MYTTRGPNGPVMRQKIKMNTSNARFTFLEEVVVQLLQSPVHFDVGHVAEVFGQPVGAAQSKLTRMSWT